MDMTINLKLKGEDLTPVLSEAIEALDSMLVNFGCDWTDEAWAAKDQAVKTLKKLQLLQDKLEIKINLDNAESVTLKGV